ncbi:hypothetical protein [Rhizobium sp. S163]|uniref:hypothetical protein n=1 Tax=Rhizobium sp. S163 TaxID=3055039 RepID=UPI0025A98600|nr:hypothetical protein [Rhizobium sp. S163]MDM9647747.1 hypothetical protein [Rhizobium sp. S163]
MSRSSLFFSRAVLFLGGLFRSIEYAGVAVLLFVVETVPAAGAFAWRLVVSIGLAAFRVIGQLKPVYRESYDTHGLSLFRLRPS